MICPVGLPVTVSSREYRYVIVYAYGSRCTHRTATCYVGGGIESFLFRSELKRKYKKKHSLITETTIWNSVLRVENIIYHINNNFLFKLNNINVV